MQTAIVTIAIATGELALDPGAIRGVDHYGHMSMVVPGDKGLVTVEETDQGCDLRSSAQAAEEEQRWVSHSADLVAWSEPQLAPLGK